MHSTLPIIGEGTGWRSLKEPGLLEVCIIDTLLGLSMYMEHACNGLPTLVIPIIGQPSPLRSQGGRGTAGVSIVVCCEAMAGACEERLATKAADQKVVSVCASRLMARYAANFRLPFSK